MPKDLRFSLITMASPLYRDLMSGKEISYAAYSLAKEKAGSLSKAVDQVLESVDFLVTPTSYRLLPELGDKAEVDKFAKSGLRIPFNVTGHPALATPLLTTSGGIPVAVQWATRQFAERGYFSHAFKVFHHLPVTNNVTNISQCELTGFCLIATKLFIYEERTMPDSKPFRKHILYWLTLKQSHLMHNYRLPRKKC